MANTEPLFPILHSEPRRSPMARRAAEATLDSTGCLTEYRPLPVRSMLSRVVSRRGLPFEFGLNPYRGCEFGCRYCYARYTHEFLEMRKPEEFEQKIYFKEHAAWLLRQELKQLKPGTEIALGTATDPYQPLERKQRVTQGLLETFAATRGMRLGIVTKSTLIGRDIALLQEIARRHVLTVHLTVTTMDVDLARLLEPRAPRPDLRMRTLAKLRDAGIRAGVLCSPLMPGITDSRSSIDEVAHAAADAGACFFAAGALFLKPCSLPTFFAFVREHFPEQLAAYERRYGANAFVAPAYRKRMAELVDSIRKKYRLGVRFGGAEVSRTPEEAVEVQPWLPFR